MWIAKIELFNFKSYQHQTFEFPQPRAGRNIVLIGGMNGYGKTSVLEALYLGLYGKEAVEHLGRAGLKDDVGYRKFVERALHGTAIRTGRDSMWVKIQINQSKAEGFEVTRKWFFSRSGDWTGEDEVVIYEVRDGIRGRALASDNLPELLDQRFIPAHVAPFFFFDGEEVKKLADQSRGDQIRTGIEGLLGVVLLRKLKKRLEEFQTNRSTGISVLDEQKHRELFEALTHHEREYEEAERKQHALDESVKSLQAQRTDLTNRMMQLGAGAGDGRGGGIFAPSLSAGAVVGASIAEWMQIPNVNLCALVGMTAFLAGVTRTPFTAFILVLEMTNRHTVIFFLMLAALVGNRIAAICFGNQGFYEIAMHGWVKRLNREATSSPSSPVGAAGQKQMI